MVGNCALFLLLASFPIWGQTGSSAMASAGTQSIGDTIKNGGANEDSHPIYLIYIHGINQVGAGDSILLRKGICKYLGECSVTYEGRVYADGGPFAIDQHPPGITYMEVPVWRTQEEWNASSPFIDRYKMVGHDHVPIILDEYNWWPLVYPLKCKWLVPNDALLTGPAKNWIDVCSPPAGNRPDPDHPGRYLAYSWIGSAEAARLKHMSRHAALANRALKNGLMDWGIGDAVMALGPMQEILTAGIRQLLRNTIADAGVAVQTMKADDTGPDFSVITHSLGSYLALAAIDSDWIGPQNPELAGFVMSPEDKITIDYFSAHATGFFFLANQLRLVELAGLSAPIQVPNSSPASPEPPRTSSASITHWRDAREAFLQHHFSMSPTPQIVAWSDPNDLLSWDVPDIEGITIVNLHVRNSGFRVAWLIVSPNSAHANYGKNQKILKLILKPNPKAGKQP